MEPQSEQTTWVRHPGRSPGPECDLTGPGTAIGGSGGLVALAGGLTLAVLLPVVGISVDAVTALVTAVRRGSRRKRLSPAERAGS
ncbi:hypothetical protein RCO28_22225 [Streptomyces sp. LHD-70]|uniref:hypothetical protein n=1 Tax=Streptomyces sp. LHD-70 TaxID=3072140 RepID=UPI00280DC59A|nr:hypothetical protein [Streptomyces sp. LHD-70]MDQ8705192.1 hypothetical protein [Streptomyces sp. LHD-70]